MSARPPFLTDDEILAFVEPLTQPAAITRWFRNNGFPDVKPRPNGMPSIAVSLFEKVFGPVEKTISANSDSEQPDVTALLSRFTKGAKKGASPQKV